MRLEDEGDWSGFGEDLVEIGRVLDEWVARHTKASTTAIRLPVIASLL